MIHCKNLFKSYKTSEFEEIILNNINLEIKDGSSVSISGKSGSKNFYIFILVVLRNSHLEMCLLMAKMSKTLMIKI